MNPTTTAPLIATAPAHGPRLVPIAGGVAPAQDSPADLIAEQGRVCLDVMSAALANPDPAAKARTLAAVGRALIAMSMAVAEHAEHRPELHLVGGDAA